MTYCIVYDLNLHMWNTSVLCWFFSKCYNTSTTSLHLSLLCDIRTHSTYLCCSSNGAFYILVRDL